MVEGCVGGAEGGGEETSIAASSMAELSPPKMEDHSESSFAGGSAALPLSLLASPDSSGLDLVSAARLSDPEDGKEGKMCRAGGR
jgi:hypothetical protein